MFIKFKQNLLLFNMIAPEEISVNNTVCETLFFLCFFFFKRPHCEEHK